MSNQRGRNTRNKPANGQGPFSGPPNFLVAEHNGRKVTVPRNSSYQETIASIKRNIQSLRGTPNDQIMILALLEEVNDYVQITGDVWPDLLARLVIIRVDLANEPDNLHALPNACTASRRCLTPTSPQVEGHPVPGGNFHGLSANNLRTRSTGTNIFVRTLTGKTQNYVIDPSIYTVDGLKGLIQDREGMPPHEQRLISGGRQLEDGRSLADYGIGDGSTVHVATRLRAGKPVIYLFHPSPTKGVRVQLSLVQSWTFSEVYPPTTISTNVIDANPLGQTVAWIVDAKPDGELFDQATGREVTYLFWEARTKPKLLLSPPATRSGSPISVTPHVFDPARPILLPSHSALLPFNKVTSYIDDTLLALGLHTEARTSFITYWLPDLSKHAYIALRFLPQDEYEQAAPLDVTPAPEVTTRVFMLFRGVAEDQVALWSEATATTRKDVTIWRDVVGIDVEKVHDKSLFRVLEWGGMEVK